MKTKDLLTVQDSVHESSYYLPYIFDGFSLEDLKYVSSLIEKTITILEEPCPNRYWYHSAIKDFIKEFKQNIIPKYHNAERLLTPFRQIGMEEICKAYAINILTTILDYINSKISEKV